MATHEQWPPNYVNIFAWRQRQFLKLSADRNLVLGAKEYYRTRPAEFIVDWCMTFDPRNAMGGLPTKLPFALFQRQKDLLQFLLALLDGQESGLVEKCRDMGATWLCCAFSVWLWLFWPGAAVGWGSRKEQLVDKIGDPSSIFEKIRQLVYGLPRFFLPAGFNPVRHVAYMKLVNPENDATIMGEAGDNIGRGGRSLIYFKDESAHYERPELIEAALGDNTNVQIDISSVTGPGTVFHRRRLAGMDWEPGQPVAPGRTHVFVMDWRHHPAKTPTWYAKREQKARDDGLLHIFRMEVDRNYAAAIDGVVIPPEWVKSAIDAHEKLGFTEAGAWMAALDVADEGGDRNALSKRKGVVLKFLKDWPEGDTGDTTRRAVVECEGLGAVEMQYDCIGVGAGVKAESNRLRDEDLLPEGLTLVPWNAGDGVLHPTERVIEKDENSPKNEDFYSNLKAQAAWQLRRRFEKTHRAITEGIKYDPDELISLSSKDIGTAMLLKLEQELSQPTMGRDSRLRLKINKKPDGMRSPNLFDTVAMNYWPAEKPAPFEWYVGT
jgi:hypothetical protein